MIDVSIIIINYNTFELTCNCIHSIYEKCKEIRYEIILVDNASIECNPHLFLEKFPNINLIVSKENVGFAKGNNLGILSAKGKYILLLNSDTALNNDAISLAYNKMISDVNIGALSSKLIFPDGRHQSCAQRFDSVFLLFIEFFRIQKFLSKKVRGELLLGSFFDHESEVEADWIWGAFFMFPANILEHFSSKLLDDRFFMYAEDKLWCKQIKSLGYKIIYYPEAVVTHYMGASKGKKNDLMLKNESIFMKMYYNYIEILMIKLFKKILYIDF